MINAYAITQFLFLGCLLLSLVTGCSRAPKSSTLPAISWTKRQLALKKLQSWDIDGKLGYQSKKEAGQLSFRWHYEPLLFNLSLQGPLGTGSLILESHSVATPKLDNLENQNTEMSITFPNGQKKFTEQPQRLLQETLEFPLPINELPYWIKGLPAPSKEPPRFSLDSKNRLQSLKQNGWTVTYESYQSEIGNELPHKLIIQGEQLRLKCIIRDWKVH